VKLGGRISEIPAPGLSDRSARLRVSVAEVHIETDEPQTVSRNISVGEYRTSEPDPLHGGAAEQLQHLAAHHPEAITLLSRLCDRESLIGVTRVLPITLDRYGIVLRAERARDHRDVRLPFSRRIDLGPEAAAEMRALLARAGRRRPCGR
jgi:hypothetical protein